MTELPLTVVLPNAGEMLKRLAGISAEPLFVQYCYPPLLQQAGREVDVSSVVMTLCEALYEVAPLAAPAVQDLALELAGSRWIDALIEKPSFAEAAKEGFKEVVCGE